MTSSLFVLSGDDAFYKDANYYENTKKDFANRPQASYQWKSESKHLRRFKKAAAVILVLPGLYKLIHIGIFHRLVVQSTRKSKGALSDVRKGNVQRINDKFPFLVKRIVIEVDGKKVDAVILGKKETIENGRWTLHSLGNGQTYEEEMGSSDVQSFMAKTGSNILMFNYAGVGDSEGYSSKKRVAKTYRAMLTFLEDKNKGIGAQEIIGFGHSLGGGVQGEALAKHQLKSDIHYVFVKHKTFSTLTKEIASSFTKVGAAVAWMLNVNLNSKKSSKKLAAPEIIVQTADLDVKKEAKQPLNPLQADANAMLMALKAALEKKVFAEILSDSKKIKDDGVIGTKATLAKALLDDKKCPKKNKVFIGVRDGHNESMSEQGLDLIAGEIKKGLGG